MGNRGRTAVFDELESLRTLDRCLLAVRPPPPYDRIRVATSNGVAVMKRRYPNGKSVPKLQLRRVQRPDYL